MKINFVLTLVILTFIFACPTIKEQSTSQPFAMDNSNLSGLWTKEQMDAMQWLNQPAQFDISDNVLQIITAKGTDYFNNPEDSSITATAPFLHTDIQGDFVAKALVQPDFSSMWNAVCLMVYIDSLHWIKFAFENSDATGPSVVSVVTRNVSDDSNGAILNDHESIWLKLIRKGDVYSMLWSSDDVEYKMARLSRMPPATKVKIGIEAQCPVGTSASHQVLSFSVVNKTVDDLRKGE